MVSILDVRPGDVFRAADGEKYCYGVIMARVKLLKEKCNPRSGHSLLAHSDDGFFYRLYRIITDSPHLTLQELAAYPLGPAVICDKLLPCDDFTFIGQTAINEDLLAFPLLAKEICFVAAHTQVAFMDALGPDDPTWDSIYGISLEWGTACVQLSNADISPELRAQIRKNCRGAWFNTWGINSMYSRQNRFHERGSLTLPEEIETVNALFPCFGLPENGTFDDFAWKWGGVSKADLIDLICQDRNS